MDYNRIVAVTGMPGLYEVISSKSDGAIVRSLEDKSTRFVSSRVHNLSHLESIEVYTNRENVVLADIFTSMKNSGANLPDVKDNKALRSYFEKVYPDLDFERVYASDMKKMIRWYEVLNQNNIDFTVKEEVPEEIQEPVTPSKKAEPKKAEVKSPEVKEEKARPKKTAEEPKKKEPLEKKAEVKKAPAKKAAEKEAKPVAKKTAKKDTPAKSDKPKKTAKGKK
jgi:hypothetical protein